MNQLNPKPVLRIMTLNLWNVQGPYEKRFPLILQGLGEINADIIGLQEVTDTSGTRKNQAEIIASELGYQYSFQGATHHPHGFEGVGIVSRYPILESDSVTLAYATQELTRVTLRSKIDTPYTPVNFYTTHLSWQLDEGYKRKAQVLDTHHFIKKHNDGLPVVLVGDFNATPDSSEIRFLTGKQSLKEESAYYQDCWAMTHPHEDGYTWSSKNKYTRSWLEPDRRIDYVFASQPTREGKGLVLDCRLVLTNPDAEGDFPSDHFGVLAEIKY